MSQLFLCLCLLGLSIGCVVVGPSRLAKVRKTEHDRKGHTLARVLIQIPSGPYPIPVDGRDSVEGSLGGSLQ